MGLIMDQRDYDAIDRILNHADTTKDELVEFILLMIEEENLDLTTALRHFRKSEAWRNS